MKTLASFYDLVMPELPGCATAMVDAQLVRVARQLCESARVLRGTFDPIDLLADTASYDLAPSEAQCETVQVHKLTINDVVLFDDSWHHGAPGDEPSYGRFDPPFSLNDTLTQITLIEDEVPSAAVSGGMVIVGSMRPTLAATKLSDLLYTTHREAMRLGVLSTLLLMAGKPWSAPAQGSMYRAAFLSATQFSATCAQNGNTRQRLRVRKAGI
jgi:hypothetical protein